MHAQSGGVEFLYQNRAEAGVRLAEALTPWIGHENLVVVGIPRGGVLVAAEVSRVLHAPLDVWVSCKLQIPGITGAVGFVSEDGDMSVDESAVNRLQIPAASLVGEIHRHRSEVRRRSMNYRGGNPVTDFHEKTVIVVDDGLTTGECIRPALLAVARSRPTRCIVAVPVAPTQAIERLNGLADEFVVLANPSGFHTVSDYYMHFRQVTDEDVTQCLYKRAQELGG